MKTMAYLRLRDLIRHRDHLAQQRWGQAMRTLRALQEASLDSTDDERRAAELALTQAETESRTWKAAEQLLTDFYHEESR